LKHYASPDFWACYRALSPEIQQLADRVWFWMGTHADYDKLLG
jgi:hypothetical protein